MTTVEDRPVVDQAELALAAEVVVSAGYGSQKLVQRKLRVAWEHSATLLAALEAGGIVDAPDEAGTWPVLVDEAGAEAILASRTEPSPVDLVEDGLADEPDVHLSKPSAGDDVVGGELAWPELDSETVGPPRWRAVAAWVRWHAFELAVVTALGVAAVTLHPAWWVAVGGAGARWAALEVHAWRHRGDRG